MRPTTPNEVAAMMKNRLERNKLRTKMKSYRVENDQNFTNIIKEKIESEIFLNKIRKNTGYTYDDDEIEKSGLFRPPSYMSSYLGKLFEKLIQINIFIKIKLITIIDL
jgi:hypothetical protein